MELTVLRDMNHIAVDADLIVRIRCAGKKSLVVDSIAPLGGN